MTSKIRIISGFATPGEVAKELRISKTELQTIERILNQPAVRKKSSPKTHGTLVVHKAATKKAASTAKRSQSGARTIWQIVKAFKESARNGR